MAQSRRKQDGACAAGNAVAQPAVQSDQQPSFMTSEASAAPNGSAMRASTERSLAPLVVHVIHTLGVGGLENGLVNLINGMDEQRFRHAIVCMTHSSEFERRIRRADVAVYSMHRDGKPMWRTYLELIRLFRKIRPAIVHSRNLSGLDAVVPALIAGVRVRVHGEHGRDVDNLDGSNKRQLRIKRLFRPLVTHYTSVSRDLAKDLIERIGARSTSVTQIYNGVDTSRFAPANSETLHEAERSGRLVIGTVGRLQPVKDQISLIRAYAEAARMAPAAFSRSKLVIVGDGPCLSDLRQAAKAESLDDRVIFAGSREDVPEVLRSMDIFVLPSLAEGISNTILEAMASGLPVVATRVGGNPDLVVDGETGVIVESGDWRSMARVLAGYACDPERRIAHGRQARLRVQREFSMDAMIRTYSELYTRLLVRP